MAATVDHSLLAEARRRLAAAPFAPPAREAALLLGRLLGLSEAQILAHATEVPGQRRSASVPSSNGG